MILTDAIAGRNRTNPPVSPTYILDAYDLNNIHYACSFRQLRSDANFAARQYALDGSSFQDIPFVNGYADTAAITSFANGAATTYELYSQGMNTLYLINSTATTRPHLTDASGNIYVDDFGKINPLHLNTHHLQVPSEYDNTYLKTLFKVQTGSTARGDIFIPGINGHYAGMYQSGSALVSYFEIGGTFVYKINGQDYPKDSNRNTLYTLLSNRQSQVCIDGYLSRSLDITRYIWNSAVTVVPHQQEYIMMKKTGVNGLLLTPENTLSIQNNQIEFYQIAV